MVGHTVVQGRLVMSTTWFIILGLAFLFLFSYVVYRAFRSWRSEPTVCGKSNGRLTCTMKPEHEGPCVDNSQGGPKF